MHNAHVMRYYWFKIHCVLWEINNPNFIMWKRVGAYTWEPT